MTSHCFLTEASVNECLRSVLEGFEEHQQTEHTPMMSRHSRSLTIDKRNVLFGLFVKDETHDGAVNIILILGKFSLHENMF